MATVPIHKANAELSKLIERSRAGENVVVARRNKPLVRLVPIEEPKREFGAMRGRAKVDDDLFDALGDEDLGLGI